MMASDTRYWMASEVALSEVAKELCDVVGLQEGLFAKDGLPDGEVLKVMGAKGLDGLCSWDGHLDGVVDGPQFAGPPKRASTAAPEGTW